MTDADLLARRFETDRARLRAIAYRMLGSRTDAEDAVQEAWLRLSRAGDANVENLGGWLTTVVARVCLDMLRVRRARREEFADEAVTRLAATADAEQEALLAESVGLAMLVVLDRLTPAERVAFVLHDMFDLPFEEIAGIVGRSVDASRQLASRARRRVRGATGDPEADRDRQRQVVEAFLAASRRGDFDALLALLDPSVVARADAAAVAAGAAPEVRGAAEVATTFAGRARAARPALVDGHVGLAWAPGGRPRVVFDFTTENGRIVAIDLIADPAHLGELELELLNEEG
ncbi:MAG TPA: sigma-70 family RNA polymerase sigma factor [Gemmatimonadales bacterium]|nr:sigma-70 family RNA polymerase sigma factor [Gemmatimonadales bacterium]